MRPPATITRVLTTATGMSHDGVLDVGASGGEAVYDDVDVDTEPPDEPLEPVDGRSVRPVTATSAARVFGP